MGIIQLSKEYDGYYDTKGYLSAYDYDVEEQPDYGLTVQMYQATIEPGHYGYFAVSNVAGTNCPTPIILATQGGDQSLVTVGYLDSYDLYDSSSSDQSLKDWLLTQDDRSWTDETYYNGEAALLQHVRYGDSSGAGRVCGGGWIADNMSKYHWVSDDEEGGQVTFSLAAPNADAVDYTWVGDDQVADYSRNQFHVTYVDSPTELPSDVYPYTPHASDIGWLKSEGIPTGFEDGTYRGMSQVVRQDMAAFLHRLDSRLA